MIEEHQADWSSFNDNPLLSSIMPKELYSDPAHFGVERHRIFRRSWHFLGHESEAPANGDYFTAQLLDQNILISRGRDGTLRAFHNVCQHRGHELLFGKGRAPVIVCPYHAWSYHTDGMLKSAGNLQVNANIDAKAICLSKVKIESVAGFLFANLDNDAPAIHLIAPDFEAQIMASVPNADELVLLGTSQGLVDANWKVMIENSLECHHCETLHKSFCQSVDMKVYRTESDEQIQHHCGAMFEIDSNGDRIEGDYLYWHIWPLTEFSVRTHSPVFSVYVNIPLSAEQTLVIQKTYVSADINDQERQRILHDYVDHNVTDLEDVAIVESVHRGLKSDGFSGGHFAVSTRESHASEHCVHHFQSLVRSALQKG
jgi:carnitine monooxygenase subunit